MKLFCYHALSFLLLVLVVSINLHGQISKPGTPPSFTNNTLKSEVPVEKMRSVDTNKLLQEDKIFDTIKDIPWRFGDNITVDINMDNAGIVDYLPNGDKIWRVGIKSEGAYTINLVFNEYILPDGAELYIYNKQQEHIIGAFTSYNNQDDGYFATTLVNGDHIIVEYYEPSDVAFKGKLSIETVTHAYRDPYHFAKSFGQSGSCNLNVACAQAEGWEDQIRSAAMLVVGSNGFCSGALINNTEFDGTPYFLSANHCYRNPSTVVFWFNWESETCENPSTPPSYDAMSGAIQRSRNSASDFWLMELNQPVPEEYNPYFAGWNRELESAMEETIIGVHHPRGDIKKFSYSETGVQASGYLGGPGSGTTHWRIVWDGGTTTEGGSSGSPIFDSQGRITGQLHGGYAACGNTQPDWYGRFGVSWDGGGSSVNALKDWLDPFGTDVQAIEGYDPYGSNVLNPEFFTATPVHSDSVVLNWQPNELDNPVMIAVNSTPAFGKPEGNYVLGGEIENGGTIIYMGMDTTLAHTGLAFSTEYHYKIWSFDANKIYSAGISTNAITPCVQIFDFPFSEGFNNEELALCWSNEIVNGETTWKTGVGNGEGYPYNTHEGERNIYFRGEDLGNLGDTSRLVTPSLNLGNYNIATLTFQYANPAETNQFDKLNMYYRTSLSEPWQLFDSINENQFSWNTFTAELNDLSESYQVAFEGIARGGRGISIDQVEITPVNELPSPFNLAYTINDDNSIELNWEITSSKNDAVLTGFIVKRDDQVIANIPDPTDLTFTDMIMPAGDYEYTVTALYQGQRISEDSNMVNPEIAVPESPVILNHTIQGEGITNIFTGEKIYKEGSILTLTALPGENHIFNHWLLDGQQFTNNPLEITLTEDTQITAVFGLQMREITLEIQPEGAAEFISGNGSYEHGSIAQIELDPAIGYIFDYWMIDGDIFSTQEDFEFVVAEDANFVAMLQYREYNIELSVSPNEAGSVSGAGMYGINANTSISTQPNPGWTFDNWMQVLDGTEVVVSLEPEFDWEVLEDASFIANYSAITPALSLSQQGEGTITPEAGQYTLTWDEEVNLGAEAAEGWGFVRWEINDEIYETSDLTFHITEDTEAVAIFEDILSANESYSLDQLVIYPSPASDQVNIQFPGSGNWNLSISNIAGQILMNYELNTDGKTTTQIDVSSLEEGIYILKCKEKNNNKTTKGIRIRTYHQKIIIQ